MLTLLAGISAFPLSAQALDCTATPDCATLGYTLSAADCTDKPTVKCPTDSSKVFCKTGPEVACAYATILGDDGLCYETLPDGVNPVGIVFDTTNKLALALNDTGSSMKWSVGYCDVSSLTNCSSASTISSCGVDGKTNTQNLQSNTCSTFPPAQAVKAYNLGSSCTATFCKQGNWFVPSARDLQTIKNNKEVLNASLTQVGGATLSGSYWASTEYSQVDAWKMEMSTNTLNFDDKVDTVAKVRPVVKYVLPSLDESGGGI